jgi:hypothetical protein
MELAKPHGGGGGYALPSGKSAAVNPLVEELGMPDTPTPSNWENPTLLEIALEEGEPKSTENAPNPLREAVETRARSSVLRPPKRLGGKGGLRTPLGDIGRQIQSLASDVSKVDKEERAQQGALESLCAQLTEAFGALKDEQREKEMVYLQRFTALEQKVIAQGKEIEMLRADRGRKQPDRQVQVGGQDKEVGQLHAGRKAPAPVSPVVTPQAPKPAGSAVNAREPCPTTPVAFDTRSQRQPGGRTQRSYATAARSAASKSQEWQTVAPRSTRGPPRPTTTSPSEPNGLRPVREKNKEARRLLFRREGGLDAPEAEREEVILALNRALAKKSLPAFIRVVDARYTRTGALSVLLERGSLGTMLIPHYRDVLVAAARQADRTVISVELPEQWYKIKVHGVPTRRYFHLGLGLAREEIELGTGFKLMRDPVWLRNPQDIEGRGSTMVVTVGSHEEFRKILTNGIRFGGTRYRTELFWELGADTVCPRCCGIGHKNFRACGDRPPRCFICAEAHEGSEHACKVVNCSAKPGTPCQHSPAKCGNCGGPHPATAGTCPKVRDARRRLTVISRQDPMVQDPEHTPEPAESESGLETGPETSPQPEHAQEEDIDMGVEPQSPELATSTASTC